MTTRSAKRRRSALVYALVGLMLGVGIGATVALADTFTCTGPNPCNGTDGNDAIAGRPVHDQIHGKGGSDAISGLGENDDLYGETGPDALIGNGADDTIEGNANTEWWESCPSGCLYGLEGEGGEDHLDGGNDSDILRGGTDDDVLNGGSGDSAYDKCWGGGGNDSYAHCARQD